VWGLEAGELGLSRVCPYETVGISLLASSEPAVCLSKTNLSFELLENKH